LQKLNRQQGKRSQSNKKQTATHRKPPNESSTEKTRVRENGKVNVSCGWSFHYMRLTIVRKGKDRTESGEFIVLFASIAADGRNRRRTGDPPNRIKKQQIDFSICCFFR